MNTLTPLEVFFEEVDARFLPLPPALEALYGRFSLPQQIERPYVISNFVSTLDGVVALNDPAHPSGGDISGSNAHDRMVMGLLRAVADVVIVGAGTFRAVPNHRWTAEYIYPPLSSAYQQLRATMGKSKAPLNVIVSASGNLDLSLPVFQSGEVSVLIVTTLKGSQRLAAQTIPATVRISTIEHRNVEPALAVSLLAKDVLQQVQKWRAFAPLARKQDSGDRLGNDLPNDILLVEGGPKLMGDFLSEHSLDELFLTIAPQIAGRTEEVERPGFVAGKLFAPDHPIWGRLVSLRRAGSHLFLRYRFDDTTT